MEKKVEELTRQLAEEKQTSRRTVAKLQREIARLKSERNYAQRGESREGLMRELDRERMLRVDAEHRLHDMRVESDSCRSRLQALQDEFRKMEEMVRSMLQYKVKIDQLKQEKTNLAATFEVNLQKSQSQISELERENMMLLNQVKKLESQMNGKGDDQDKSKLLLQRLKMLEAENSSLVLENEQQRQQYEKCLDEIANQVVQALLAQKTLREECMKLQTRVHDLEHQNRQLNYMFQQRLRYSNEPAVQSHAVCKAPAKISAPEVKSTDPETDPARTSPPPAPPLHPLIQQQIILPHQNRQSSKQRGATPVYLENSTESIQSMCSDYMFDDSPGKPQMSSPPPWLKEKLDKQTDDRRSSRSSTESPSSIPSSASPVRSLSSSSTPTTTVPPPQDRHRSKSSPALQIKIETEFPVNNSSPKIKHVNVSDSGCKSLDRSEQQTGRKVMKSPSRLHKKVKTIPKSPVSGSGSPVVHSKIPTSSKGTPVLSANQVPQQRTCDSPKSNLSNQRSSSVTPTGKPMPSASHIPPQRSCDSPKSNVSNQRSGNNTGGVGVGSPRASSRGIPVLSANALPRQRSCESPREPVCNGVRRRSCDTTPENRISGPKHSTPYDAAKLRQSHGAREGSPRRDGTHPASHAKQSPPFHSQYYYDYSDEDSDCRPVNPDCDTESTMSLNELLDNSMDGDLQLDDDFLSDWSPICLSPTNQNAEYPLNMTPQGMFFNMTGGKPVPIIQSKSGPYATIIVKEGRSSVVDEAYGLAGCRPLRPDNLILAPRDKHFTSCGFSSSSSSAEEAKSFLSSAQTDILETCVENSNGEVNSEKSCVNSKLSNSEKSGENSRTLNSEKSLGNSKILNVEKTSENSKPLNSEKSIGNSMVLNGEKSIENSKVLISEKSIENSTMLNSETGIEKSRVLNSEKSIENSGVLNSKKSCENSKKLETPINDENSLAGTFSIDANSQQCSVSPSDHSPKENLPKTSTPISEHESESKTKMGLSKIPLMSPTSPKKAPPPIPKKPKFQKNVPQLKLESPTNKRNVQSLQSKIPPPGIKSSGSSSNPSSPVSKTSSPATSPKSALAVGEKQSCSVDRDQSESESSRQNVTCAIKLGPLKGSEKVNGLVLDKHGLPYLCENLTVERQRDLAAFLVQDVIERVKNQDATIYQPKCQPLGSDTGFDSVRVERSGSKDDGYSTMSSDIQPEALKEFADPVSKAEDGIITDLEKLAESALSKVKGQLQDFSSDPDSAMENSTHSCEMRTSSHSLSSQVSSSSGEGILSPGHKVQNMKKFFEDAAKNTSRSEQQQQGDRSPIVSPQSPITHCHSELGKISKIPIFQHGVPLSTTATTQDSTECSRIPASEKPMQNRTIQPSAKGSDPKGASSTQDRNIFQSDPQGKASTQVRNIFDLRKDNSSLSEGSCNSSEDDISLNDGSVPATDIFYQDVSSSSSGSSSSSSSSSSRDDSGLGHMMSLHISEEKILEDIPEDDEWEILHNKNVQEHFHNQYDLHHNPTGVHFIVKDGVSMETVRPLSAASSASASVSSITLTLSSPTPPASVVPSMCLVKARSETELSSLRHPRTTSKYEDFLDGNWDSGKVPERSASVSEMDVREPAETDLLRAFRRTVVRISVDEDAVLCRVQSIINRLYTSQTCLSTDNDTSGEMIPSVDFLDKWKQKDKVPYNLPMWNPKETMEMLLKNSTPSPVSVTKFNSANAEDWLLQFSKEDIDRHLSNTRATDPTLPHDGNAENIPKSLANKFNECEMARQGNCYESVSSNRATGDSDTSGFGSQLNDGCSDQGMNVQGEAGDELAADKCCQSPSEQQTRFNSRFYSLCPVGPDSKSSLFSNGSRDCDMNKLFPVDTAAVGNVKCLHTPSTDSLEMNECGAIPSRNSFESKECGTVPSTDSFESKEFETISRQIADLSKTVTDLHHSLSSLNSDVGSTDDLHNYLPCSLATHSNSVLDGYHWEEDEIFMTSCGGEVIIGNSEMLTTGCSDWLNESMEENGATCFLDSGSGGDIHEQFYEIQVNGTSCSSGHFSGEVNSSLDRTRTDMGSGGYRLVEKRACFFREKRASLNDGCLEDPVTRANMLDSMLASGGESNDSLASDIGLDHMMCQRLTGSSGKPDAIHNSTSGQLPLDFSKFFIRYGEQEQQAVAAFDFLDEFSASNSECTSPQQFGHLDNKKEAAEAESPPSTVCPSVCVLDCRIDASGRVRKIDKNRRKKRADERKEQKQRENNTKSHIPRYSCDQRNSCHNISSDSAEFLPGEGLSLSDSCHESFSSSSPTFNSVTML
ncbi:serine-rich adhesin for platelets-like [Gigantopelta aegis]|uniref:serine-rich adhesin for platelets-like n=1 Tax=Gigantopelta aegis TaxID=1735272 RepID=UPI001B88C48A|nr:serine-rich adhesin for platelets-like [Gigantopelta aegis]